MTHMRWISIIGAIALAALLAGCASVADDRTGSGPMTLSPSAEAGFQEYSRLDNPGAFAVSQSGAWGYSFCDQECGAYSSKAASKSLAITYCEQNSSGKPCFIYAIGDQIVWRSE